MASTTPLPPLSPRHPSLVYEHHPDLGDYVYSPSIDLWTNRRVTSEGQEILLAGQGRRPSDEQVRSWRSIEAHLEDLTTKAIAVVPMPPAMPRRSQFSRQDLSLREVLIAVGGDFDFFFDTPLGDELDIWPKVTFQDTKLKGCEWVA